MSNVAKNILSNTAIQMIGKITTAVLSIVVIKYITTLETVPGLEGLPADYKLIYTYLAFFGIVADFGLFTIAVREMAHCREQEEENIILGNILGMRLFTIITTMILAGLFVFLIPFENYTTNVKVGVVVAAISTVLTMLASTTSSILQVHLKMTMPTVALVLGKILTTGYIIWTIQTFTTLPNAFFHLIFAGVAGSLFTFLVTWYYTNKWFPFKPKMDVKYWKKIFKEALPYGTAIILSTIYFKIDILLLSVFRDKQEIAIYGYPSSIIEMLAIFPIYFMNSTLPTLSKAFKNNREKAKKIISIAFQFLCVITIPMVIGGILLARPIMAFIMNEDFLTGNVSGYYGADIAFQLLLFPTLFAFVNTLFSFTLIAAGKQGKLLKINFYGVLFNIITNLLFIPTYGFIAAGMTTIFSELLIIILTYRECRKEIKIPFNPVSLSKIAGSTLVMSLFISMIQPSLHIIPTVVLGAFVFMLALLPLRFFSRESS